MQVRISVILCTHNPRHDYLNRVLDRLRAQTLPLEQWEFLLVDNASTEQLADVWDVLWHPSARHIRENTLGLTHARSRGIDESTGDLLIFLDDDNLLALDFLAMALDIHVRNPHLGAFGAGELEPEFESPPPPELSSYFHFLALRTVQRERWSNNARDHSCIPWGAGLCVTRSVASAYRDLLKSLEVTQIMGRRGQELFCGEDDLFSIAALTLGKGFGIFPALQIVHLIEARRLTHSYIARLVRGHAFSHGVLDYVLFGVQPAGIRYDVYARAALHGIKHGRFSLRCKWATAQGEDSAARYIAENRLQSRMRPLLSIAAEPVPMRAVDGSTRSEAAQSSA